jgi:hypothetical protein
MSEPMTHIGENIATVQLLGVEYICCSPGGSIMTSQPHAVNIEMRLHICERAARVAVSHNKIFSESSRKRVQRPEREMKVNLLEWDEK